MILHILTVIKLRLRRSPGDGGLSESKLESEPERIYRSQEVGRARFSRIELCVLLYLTSPSQPLHTASLGTTLAYLKLRDIIKRQRTLLISLYNIPRYRYTRVLDSHPSRTV
jgi:hypothetical protein